MALVTLMTELTLTRIFDAALGANMAYLVITCAIFAFGLAGIYSTLWPLTVDQKIDIVLTRLAVLLAFFYASGSHRVIHHSVFGVLGI